MKSHVRFGLCLVFSVFMMIGLPASPGTNAQQEQWMPPPAMNLKVLPSDTEGRALVATMRSFTRGLGVRCQHCHVYKGDNPDDLTTFDFASDEKQEKLTARTMLRMVQEINDKHLKDVGEHAALVVHAACALRAVAAVLASRGAAAVVLDDHLDVGS